MTETSREKRLLGVLRRLVETLDEATITFDSLPPERSLEATLEFDEAYITACEELGIPAHNHHSQDSGPSVAEPREPGG